MNYISKSSVLSPYLKATSTAVAKQTRPLAVPVVLEKKSVSQPPQEKLTSYSLGKSLPTGKILASSGGIGAFSGRGQHRLAHTDIKFPNFSKVLNSEFDDPNKSTEGSGDKRNAAAFGPAFVGGTLCVYAAKSLVTGIVQVWSPSADELAMGRLEVDLTKIPEGKSITFKWRGKPVFIKHRTAEDISREGGVPLAELRDPQHDSERVKDPKWLVVLGVCTHLGCVPLADAGDFGGYFCPCHGSHYDGSGRIRKGPAPLNLEVPPHEIVGDTLVIG